MEIDLNSWSKAKSIFIGVVILIFLIFSLTKKNNIYHRMYTKKLNKHFQGFVIDKFLDVNNHSIPTIVLESNKKVSIEGEFFKKISIGDSISKKKGEHLVILYKSNNDTLIFDYQKLIEQIKELHTR